MAFCGNAIELVELHKILDDKEEFIKWTEFDSISSVGANLQVYIEKNELNDLKKKNRIVIDAYIAETKTSEKIGLLFIKKENNVYG